MNTEEPTGSCICCGQRDPLPDLTPACGVCRSRARNQLREIPLLCRVLAAGPPAEAVYGGDRRIEEVDQLIEVDGRLAAVVRTHTERSVMLAAGAVPGQSTAPRVAGSREAPVPISVDRTDLLSAARSSTSASRDLSYPEQDEDQVGYLSVATVLDGWCRDIAEGRRETPPHPIPPVQCSWLTDRLDWLFVEHPAVDEFTGEVGDLWHVLRRAAGLTTPRPELCEGVPCRACDLRALYRVPGSQYVECDCGQLYTEDEYREWLGLVTAPLKRAGNVVPHP